MRGELLRSLRRERGWTQEEAAHRARVSEKLFRKAEQGGRVDARSLAALAAIFSEDSRGELRSQDLLLSEAETSAPCESMAARVSESNRSGSPAGRILEDWLQATWVERTFERLDRWAAPDIVFHCEAGVLHGRESVRRRYERFGIEVESATLSVEALKQTGDSAACRWRTVDALSEGGDPTKRQRVSIGGATAIRLGEGLIVEASEFLDSRHSYQQLETAAENRGSSSLVR